MQIVVGVSFKKAGKIYYFDPSEIELRSEDKVIVETSRGIELGEVVINPRGVEEDQIVQPLKKVIRKATPKDVEQLEINIQKEKEAYNICLEKIGNHGLPMKLVDVEYTFDNNKIIFYFTADGRVDFRELVKDLASVFRTRIELRQIGVRDEAKMIGGLGPCGLELCCKTFLREFEPISIKMAKNQELSLNPAKISGICGRLMCCLRFESDDYDEVECDEIIDDPGELLEEEVDEYEKYMNFARKYAKQPDPVPAPLKEEEEPVEATPEESLRPEEAAPQPQYNGQRKNSHRDGRGPRRDREQQREQSPEQTAESNREQNRSGSNRAGAAGADSGEGAPRVVSGSAEATGPNRPENKGGRSDQKGKKPYNKNKGGYQGNKGGKPNNQNRGNNSGRHTEGRNSEKEGQPRSESQPEVKPNHDAGPTKHE